VRDQVSHPYKMFLNIIWIHFILQNVQLSSYKVLQLQPGS
jgi:hypothetical protein